MGNKPELNNITYPVYQLLKKETANVYVASSGIDNLSDADIDTLKSGDIVEKITGNQKHTYIVTYKEEKHGICLSYFNAGYTETVSYDYIGGHWVYNSKDVVEIPTAQNIIDIIHANQQLDIGDLIVLPNMIADVETTTGGFFLELTKAQYDKVPDNGLVIIMFNTTCVIIPFIKGTDNRFICNAVYNTNYDAMVVRGKIKVHYEDIYSLYIKFNTEYISALLQNPTVRPYGVVRFVGM